MVYPLPTRGLDTSRQLVYPRPMDKVSYRWCVPYQRTTSKQVVYISHIKGPDTSRLVVYIFPEVQVQQAGAVESPTRGLVKESQVAYPLPGGHQIYKHASAASPTRGPDVSL